MAKLKKHIKRLLKAIEKQTNSLQSRIDRLWKLADNFGRVYRCTEFGCENEIQVLKGEHLPEDWQLSWILEKECPDCFEGGEIVLEREHSKWKVQQVQKYMKKKEEEAPYASWHEDD